MHRIVFHMKTASSLQFRPKKKDQRNTWVLSVVPNFWHSPRVACNPSLACILPARLSLTRVRDHSHLFIYLFNRLQVWSIWRLLDLVTDNWLRLSMKGFTWFLQSSPTYVGNIGNIFSNVTTGASVYLPVSGIPENPYFFLISMTSRTEWAGLSTLGSLINPCLNFFTLRTSLAWNSRLQLWWIIPGEMVTKGKDKPNLYHEMVHSIHQVVHKNIYLGFTSFSITGFACERFSCFQIARFYLVLVSFPPSFHPGAHQMEPPSPLISWVNPFPSRFINRTIFFCNALAACCLT